MIKKRSFDKKVAICSRLKLIFFNFDLIKLIVAIFKLTVYKVMLFLLNQKIQKKKIKIFKVISLIIYFFHKIYLKLRKI